MSTTRGGLLLLLLLFACHSVGILLFCKGFLLKRVVIPEYSPCLPPSSADESPAVSHSCGDYPRTFKRVVWLLVDALRYDFTVYNDTLDPVPVYRNKLPYIRDLLLEKPRNAKLFRFVADPPTTTMQRLKALTTGSLPTFVDFSSNFNSYEISEDSLPYQAKANQRNFTFMGDDTWLGLYPDMMTKTFDYPSLNVKDLHTVDNGVISHMVPELELNDAEFVVGHFLGVDHVGHTYGPSHPSMGEKLSQMNEVLKSIFAAVDEDTIVFVFGDHGMTPTGDHGGETGLETDAALLLYTPRPLFDPAQASGRSLFQIDIVPTVSLLLGLPIPFSSLGMIIPEVFLPFMETGHSPSPVTGVRENAFEGRVTIEFLSALKINAKQIKHYLETYVEYSEDFPQDVYQELRRDYDHALQLHGEVTLDGNEQQDRLVGVALAYIQYMKSVKRMCQGVWAKFDNWPIAEGLFLLLLSVCLAPVALLNIQDSIKSMPEVMYFGFVAGAVTGLSVTLVQRPYFEFTLNFVLSVLIPPLFYSVVLTSLLLVWYMKYNMFQTARVVLKLATKQSSIGIIRSLSFTKTTALVITALYGISLLSNSFIIYEADMVIFFLQTLVVCFTLERLQVEYRASKEETASNKAPWLILCSAVVMLCIRLTKFFHACRDLQMECEPSSLVLALPAALELMGLHLAKLRFLGSCLCVILVPASLALYIRHDKDFKYLSKKLIVVVTYGLPLASLCTCGFWFLLALPQSTLDSLPFWQHVVLPRAVYFICCSIVVLVVVEPFRKPSKDLVCEDLEVKGSDVINPLKPSSDGVRPRKPDAARNAASNIHIKQDTSFMETKFTLPLVILLASAWVSLSLLLNDGVTLAAFLLVIQVGLALSLFSGLFEGDLLSACVFWGLMCNQFFFAFGHHATVTSLRFEAGFVGLRGEITPYNLPVAALLVGLNILASQLLFGLGLPLLLLSRVGVTSKPVILEKLLRAGVQYLMFHSIKMVVSVAAASIHRRHLMIWGVFSPRFLYESAFQATSDVCTILVFLLAGRLLTLVEKRTTN